MPDLRDRLAAALSPRYTVDRELASGGMGTVFLGVDPTLGREVAIKVLPPERATAVAVERFLREARLLAKLSHPNIVPVFESQSSGGLLWFVMPRIRGDTLAHRLLEGPLPAETVRRFGRELLGALQHAHEHGVVHRDIKPANVFLDGDRALLADFGVALLNDSSVDTLTSPDQMVGTLRYMAPEQHTGGEVTERSDIYALAVTLFEAATGQRWDPTVATTSSTWRRVPPRLRAPLRTALNVDPAARWGSAAAFRDALDRSRPQRWLIGAGVLAVAAVAIVGARGALAPAVVATSRAELVVLPFAPNTDGAELSRLVSLPIEYQQIRVMPAVLAERIPVDSAMRVANFVVTGRVLVRDGRSDSVEIHVFRDGTTHASIRMPRTSEDLAAWGLDIADSIVRVIAPGRLTEFRELAYTHPNRNALDAYAEGQRLFQRGQWHDAEMKFAEAERLDSQFVEATWHKLIARQWQSLPFKEELARLAAGSKRKPAALARLLDAQVQPDLDRRFALYDSLEREYPDYSLVREMAANERFSRGPLVGHPLREGITAFQDAARDIPDLDQANTYTQTVWGAVRIGDERLAREQLRRRHAPENDPWADILWLAVNGRFRRWLAIPAREVTLLLADSSDVTALSRAVRMGLDVDDPWDQDAIARFLERRAQTGTARANALAARATAHLLLGQPMEALRLLDLGAQQVPGDASFGLQGAEWRVLLPLLPGAAIPLDPAVRDSGRRTLRNVPRSDSLWPRAAWALAVDAISRNADRERDSIAELLHQAAAQPWASGLATQLDAIVLGARRQPDSALALSRSIRRVPGEDEARLRGAMLRAFVYLSRGAWQAARGNAAGAESEWIWHENNDIASKPQGEPEQGELDAALSAQARLLRAENLPALDRLRDACALFDRVHELWRDAEPAMQSLRTRVDAGRQRCRR